MNSINILRFFTIYSDVGDNSYFASLFAFGSISAHSHSPYRRPRNKDFSIRHTNVYRNVLFTATRGFGIFYAGTVCWYRLREPLVSLGSVDATAREEEAKKEDEKSLYFSVHSNWRIQRETKRKRANAERICGECERTHERNENCVFVSCEQSAQVYDDFKT